jgi:hypothetical protein
MCMFSVSTSVCIYTNTDVLNAQVTGSFLPLAAISSRVCAFYSCV